MFDGMIRAVLHALQIEPEEAKTMVDTVVSNVVRVDRRLARIEEALGIEPGDPVTLDGELTEPEYDGQEHVNGEFGEN